MNRYEAINVDGTVGTCIAVDHGDYVRYEDASLLAAENERMKAEMEALKQQEPVTHQFQDREGNWCNFGDERHYRSTLEDGSWPIRALYAGPVVNQQLTTGGQQAEQELGAPVRFQLRHAFSKETRIVEFSHAELADDLVDAIYEKLGDQICKCDVNRGEAGDDAHGCVDYIDCFDILPGVTRPSVSGLVEALESELERLTHDERTPNSISQELAALLITVRAHRAKGGDHA